MMNVEKMVVSFCGGSEISSACAEVYNRCLRKECKEISFNFNGINITMKRSEDD